MEIKPTSSHPFGDISIIPPMRYSRVVTNEKHEFGGHRHSDWEIKFVFSGNLEVTCDDRVIKLSPCEVMLIEPEVFHREITACGDYMVLQMLIDGIPKIGKARVARLDVRDLELAKMIKYHSEAFTESSGDDLNKRGVKITNEEAMYTLAKLTEVMLYKLLSATDEAAEPNSENKGAVVYNKAVNYMRDNLNRNLCLSEISKSVGACPTVLKNAFSKYTGHGIMQHFTYMRMIRAKALLDDGLTASEVSFALGFSSQSYFTQSFKRECGCTPSKYLRGSR